MCREITAWALPDTHIVTAHIKRCCLVAAFLALSGCATVQKSESSAVELPRQQERLPNANVNEEYEPTSSVVVEQPDPTTQKPNNEEQASTSAAKDELAQKPTSESQQINTSAKKSRTFELPKPVIVDRISRTGTLRNRQLSEVSGLVASSKLPGVLYAINDSGDSPTLYALSENGKHLGQWAVKARNRDWEDLDSVKHNNQTYILIGDTGDNRKSSSKSTFYLVPEPLPDKLPDELLTPYMTIDFIYEDGPRNVEAFAVHGMMIYLISKEPVSSTGARASRLYALEIPAKPPSKTLTARFITELPLARSSLESKLAASLVGVDLDHITAMDITASGRSAYLLTYKEVLKIERGNDESWSTAFQRRGKRIHRHGLAQAEALAIAPGRSVFVTSEKQSAPLWAIPIQTSP